MVTVEHIQENKDRKNTAFLIVTSLIFLVKVRTSRPVSEEAGTIRNRAAHEAG